MPQFDAIIVGAGHNGLVAACYLARAGRRVLVLERRHVVGGAAVTEEVFPRFKFSVCSYAVSLLRPEIIQDLDLHRFGLHILPLHGTLTPLERDALWRPEDTAESQQEIARFSPRDAAAYPAFLDAMREMAQFVKPMLSMTPPDIGSIDPRGVFDLFTLGRRLYRLPRDRQHLLAALMSMSAADFVEQWFESEPLKATLAASGIIGTTLGVRSPGTAYVLLHHYMGEIDGEFRSWGVPRGGMGAVSQALADAATELGVTIQTSAAVEQILLRDGAASGVALTNGDEHQAPVILSNADVRTTFERMVGWEHVPEDFASAIRRYRFRGSTAKVNLALDGVPEFTGRPGVGPHLAGAISISPDLDTLERAYDESKYGAFSTHPYIDIVMPSLNDDTLAPPGQHVMSCFVQYAPYHLAGGADWDANRDALGDAVIRTLARYAPGLPSRILHRQVVTPLDLERDFGLTEGNIFHGELSPDQLFSFRPAPGWARYRTPIFGLYLCGSSTHPGGGVMGACGRNAARQVLKETAKAR